MSPIAKNTLKSMLVLATVAVFAVLALALANAFFPKYTPKLDEATVKILNEMVPTGEDDAVKLLEDGYYEFAIEFDDLAKWNRLSGSAARGYVLAVYKLTKGENAGVLFVETETPGYGGSLVKLVTAISPDGTLHTMYVRDMPPVNNYYSGDIDGINDLVAGKTQITVGELKPIVTLPIFSGATFTTNAFVNAVNLSAAVLEEVAAHE